LSKTFLEALVFSIILSVFLNAFSYAIAMGYTGFMEEFEEDSRYSGILILISIILIVTTLTLLLAFLNERKELKKHVQDFHLCRQ